GRLRGSFVHQKPKGPRARLSKCFVSIFGSFSTKALHFETASSLTSEAFVTDFLRFVGHRGKPSHVYSDNGSTFIGARRELHEFGQFLLENNEQLSDLFSQDHVEWHFIPVQAPHIGGLWKAGVKSSDTMLLIKEYNVPPLQWRLGRIVYVYPRRDNVN
ncbi:hypothetical protein HUJ04_005985, partial [Dendroctonus ponderosae]